MHYVLAGSKDRRPSGAKQYAWFSASRYSPRKRADFNCQLCKLSSVFVTSNAIADNSIGKVQKVTRMKAGLAISSAGPWV